MIPDFCGFKTRAMTDSRVVGEVVERELHFRYPGPIDHKNESNQG